MNTPHQQHQINQGFATGHASYRSYKEVESERLVKLAEVRELHEVAFIGLKHALAYLEYTSGDPDKIDPVEKKRLYDLMVEYASKAGIFDLPRDGY